MSAWDRLKASRFQTGNLNYSGISIGGERTCHTLSSMDLSLDIGEATPESICTSKVFISHLHDDHWSGIKSHFFKRQYLKLLAPSYYVWENKLEEINTLFKMSREILGYSGPDLKLPLVSYKTGDRLELTQRHFALIYLMQHRITNHGIGLFELRTKLKQEYVGLDIGKLKKSNPTLELLEQLNYPLFFYSGDTSIEALTSEILSFETILLECTILGLPADPTTQQVNKAGHIHFEDLLNNIKHFKCKRLYLTHLSSRYNLITLNQVIPDLLRQLKEKTDIDITFLEVP